MLQLCFCIDGAHFDLLVFFKFEKWTFLGIFGFYLDFPSVDPLPILLFSTLPYALWRYLYSQVPLRIQCLKFCAELPKFLPFNMACYKLQLTDILICLMP